jgi:hypothetical protein
VDKQQTLPQQHRPSNFNPASEMRVFKGDAR